MAGRRHPGGGFAAVVPCCWARGLLVRALRPLQRSRTFAVRYAARRVRRPGNQTRPILLAVGLGAFLVVGVRTLQANSCTSSSSTQARHPGHVPDRRAGRPGRGRATRSCARPRGSGGEPAFIPVLRARVTGRPGPGPQPGRLRGRARARRRPRARVRDHVSGRLERNERVVAGHVLAGAAPDGAARCPSSRACATGTGSTRRPIRFDVLGRVVEARVTSVRKVDWADAAAGGFMFVFRPGLLEAAPATFIVPVRGPGRSGGAGRASSATSRRVPERLGHRRAGDPRRRRGVIRNVTMAVTVVGALVLFGGILILVGSISMTKFQRVYEAAVLKTLGATTGRWRPCWRSNTACSAWSPARSARSGRWRCPGASAVSSSTCRGTRPWLRWSRAARAASALVAGGRTAGEPGCPPAQAAGRPAGGVGARRWPGVMMDIRRVAVRCRE